LCNTSPVTTAVTLAIERGNDVRVRGVTMTSGSVESLKRERERCLESGDDGTRADRLLRAARQVLDRLANQLGGAAATVALANADARPAGTRVTASCDGAAITVMPSTDSDLKPRAIITSSTDDFLASPYH
jgi:hypothetical protein